jgi:Tfp pilus assembly protein PilN
MPNVSGPSAATQPLRSGTVVLPRVNLMPPEIHEAARFRRFQLGLAAAGAGAIVIVGALFFQAHSGVASAKSQLADAQARHAQLEQQRQALQPVQDVYNQVAAKRAMLQQAMGGEIRWSYYLNDLSLKIPENVWLTNVSATETGTGLAATGTSAAANNPTAQAAAAAAASTTSGVGSINFGGVAFSHDDVANWLDSLAREKGYANPYFSNSTETFIGPRKVVTFTSSVQLTPAAYSNRYSTSLGN